jgi:predicted dehydrogenase
MMDTRCDFLNQAQALNGLPDTACFTDLDEALKVESLEACIINTPARFHAEQMQAALERGLHVLVAKPMVYDWSEAVRLVELAEQKGVALLVDQQQQFTLCERTMAQWIRQEKFGVLGFGSTTIHRYRPNVGSFIGPEPFIWEQGVHLFNSLLALIGQRALSIQAAELKPAWSSYNGPTVCMGIIEFECPVHRRIPIQFLGTFDSRQSEQDIRFEFERGAVRLSSTGGFGKRIYVAQPGQSFEDTEIDDAQDSCTPENFNLDNFYHAARMNERVINDGRDNLHTLAIVDAFLRSVREGRKIDIAQTA